MLFLLLTCASVCINDFALEAHANRSRSFHNFSVEPFWYWKSN